MKKIYITRILKLVVNRKKQREYLKNLFQEADHLYHNPNKNTDFSVLHYYTQKKIVKQISKEKKHKKTLTTIYLPKFYLEHRKKKGEEKQVWFLNIKEKNVSFYLRGGKQLNKFDNIDDKIYYIVLKRKYNAYYLHVLLYVHKEKWLESVGSGKFNKVIGVDFGIKHQITLSNGYRINFQIPETKRMQYIKQLEQARNKLKESINYLNGFLKKDKLIKHINKSEISSLKENMNAELEALNNVLNSDYIQQIKIQEKKKEDGIRNNIFNAIIHYLRMYKYVGIQDDPIDKWNRIPDYKKALKQSGLMKLQQRLKKLTQLKGGRFNVIEIPREQITSKICSRCGYEKKRQSLKEKRERKFICEHCHLEIDRDVNAARNIAKLAAYKVFNNLPRCVQQAEIEKLLDWIEDGNLASYFKNVNEKYLHVEHVDISPSSTEKHGSGHNS